MVISPHIMNACRLIEEILNEEQIKELIHQLQLTLQFKEWKREEEETQKIYPQLSLCDEVLSKQFCEYLCDGYSVKTAYEKTHNIEIPKRKRTKRRNKEEVS